MIDQLPILVIIVPLMAAPLLVIIGNRFVAYAGAVVASWATFGIAVKLTMDVAEKGRLSYNIGGWLPPYGIEYVVDPFTAYVVLFVSFIGAIVLTYAWHSVNDEVDRSKHTLFYATYLLCMTGLLGMVVTGDLFNVFVFLEISSLSSYALIALGRTRRAPLAALQYLILGTVGATFFLIGIGLLYQMTGTLNMAGLAERLPRESGSRTLMVAFAMMSVGLAIKMAVFPVHTWLPNAYSYAPSAVTAFIAATSTKVSVYAFIRLMYTVFGADFAFNMMPLDTELMVLGLLGIYVASVAAIYQDDIKRLLAYSSVAQIGYMLLGVSLNDVDGLAGGIAHLMNHAVIKGGLFMAVGAIVLRIGSSKLDDMRGIGKTMPWTSLAVAVGGLALIGVPVTAGFVTKWMLLTTTLKIGAPIVAGLMLVSSLLAVVYVWRIVETIYFSPPSEKAMAAREAPPIMLATTWIVIGLTIVLGVWTTCSAGLATEAAHFLLGDRS